MRKLNIFITVIIILGLLTVLSSCAKKILNRLNSESERIISQVSKEVDYSNLEYDIADGEVTITGYKEKPSGKLVIPKEIEGCPVTTIGNYTFSGCDPLTSVEMPNVQTIGEYAFYSCESLTTVKMPNVLVLDNGAFADCKSLTSVEMPNVKEVAGNSFSGTAWYDNLTDEFCVFGDGVLVKYCGADTDVTVPDNVKCVVGFYENKNIKTVSMPKVQTIGGYAFSDCDSLTSIEMPNVQTIGDSAFYDCHSLTSVEMPKVQTIGDDAFMYCRSLTSVEMPNVQTIGDDAFDDCDSLTSAYFYSDAPSEFSGDVFYGCADGFTIYYAKGTKGWTSPTWHGYPTKEFDPE